MPPHTQAWRVAHATGCRYTDARIAINLLVNRTGMTLDDAADKAEAWARDGRNPALEAQAFLRGNQR